ncbi:MAG: hypothetical protein HYZ84_07320 [Candidatus Omnitrophica bacterium]|nr:hypothetical protein [Candidatus Omnitrophota bacterium]
MRQKKTLRAFRHSFFSILTLFFSVPVFAAGEISLMNLQLSPLIPVKSAYYTIDPKVLPAAEPGFLQFHIHSAHADYEIEGLVALKKLLHEIEVIEQIRRNEAGSGFFEGITDSLSDTGEGFVRLVSHPIKSVQGVGKAAGKLAGKVGGIFRKKEAAEKTSFSEKMLGSAERDIANKFSVDVYTTNPYLKELLRRMAKARLGGEGAAMIGKILIPVAALVSVTITVSGVNGAADRLVNDKNRYDLYQLNHEALVGLGFAPAEITKFLNNPQYTPREFTYIRFYLEKLKDVPGHREILRKAAAAQTPWQVKKILYEAQIAADRMKETAPYQKLQFFEEGLAVLEKDKVVLIVPYDYLDKSRLSDSVLQRVSELKTSWHQESAEIASAGKITQGFLNQAFAKGIKTSDRILLK